MGRPLRFVPPRQLVEVTCRTFQGRYLLSPSRALNDIVVGVLGRAQRLYSLEIQAFAVLSNHYHLLVSPDSAQQLAAFMGYFNGNLAKEVGKLGRWKGRLWERRYTAILVSDEEEAQVARLRYLLSQGTKEGLVRSPARWSGVHCARALLSGAEIAGTWFDRTREHETRRPGQPIDPSLFAEREVVDLAPLPCWAHLDEGIRRNLVQDLVTDIEQEAARARAANKSGPWRPLSRGLAEARPTRPKTAPAPRVHAACRGVREALLLAYRTFEMAYREAARRLRGGDPDPRFPPGCFPPALPFVPVDSGLSP
ncbi:MAG TPA: transposase [Thermoanaerobaculia bacterium]|nr:transposase [Thermoanaerobaculia bacterium]